MPIIQSVSESLAYILHDDDDELEIDSRTGASRFVVVEVNVPADVVGVLIGRQGSQIKAIQESTKTRISFKGDRSTDKDKDRVLVIRGTQETIHQAELMVRKIIVDQPVQIADSIAVPCETVGRIIGRNGDSIRTMSRSSKAKITIERTDARNQVDALVTVHLKGSQNAIEIAKSLILEKVAEEKEYRDRKNKLDSKTEQSTESTKEPQSREQLGDDYVPVYVTAVEHPEHFWLQFLSNKSAELDKLLEQMTDFYGHKNLGDAVTELHEGDLVAAPFEHDSQWYRTQVIGVQDDSVDLYYVDFGDSGFIAKDRIKTLRNDFKDLPFQAVECCLADVKPSEGTEWSSPAIDVFEELCHTAKWKAIMARVIESKKTVYGSKLQYVQLIDTNESTDVDIAGELVKQGFAKGVSSVCDDRVVTACDKVVR